MTLWQQDPKVIIKIIPCDRKFCLLFEIESNRKKNIFGIYLLEQGGHFIL